MILRRAHPGFLIAFVAALLCSSHGARAQTADFTDATCPGGNVLRTARLIAGSLGDADLAKMGDGAVAPEGAAFPDDRVRAVLPRTVTFDLGALASVRQIVLQTDADQPLSVDLSRDQATWTRVPIAAHATASGMLTRVFEFSPLATRFLKLSAADTAPSVAVTELEAFCSPQPKPRTRFRVIGAPPDPPDVGWLPGVFTRVTGAPVISPTGANWMKLFVVLGAASLVALGWRSKARSTFAAWGTLAALSVVAYLNVGAYRYPTFVHDHDVFHYFVGAKYFPEIGYDELYSCAAIAEAEAGFSARVRLRSQRDLTTNRLITGSAVLTQASACHARFQPERWTAFRDDVAYFANGRTVEDWHRVLKDHGFNASPTWIALGRSIGGRVPAAEWSIGHRAAIFAGLIGPVDPVLLLVALGTVLWAFGLRTACLVAIVFGCNPLSEFSWVGGGFLREAWLASLVIALCLAKREHFLLAGAGLAVSALLQLFPAACLASVGAGLAVSRYRTGLFNRAMARILVGAALTTLVVTPLSAFGSGRSGAFPAFLTNTEKHTATPSGNLVGLGTLLSFRSDTTVSRLFDDRADDPFARARAARVATAARMRPAKWLVVVVGAILLLRAFGSGAAPWWSAALGLALVPLGIDASCYYTSWLAAFALIGHETRRPTLLVLGMIALALAIRLSRLPLDVDSAVASLVCVAGVLGVLFVARPLPS